MFLGLEIYCLCPQVDLGMVLPWLQCSLKQFVVQFEGLAWTMSHRKLGCDHLVLETERAD